MWFLASCAWAQSDSSCVFSINGGIKSACLSTAHDYGFKDANTFYGHNVLGNTPEWQTIVINERNAPYHNVSDFINSTENTIFEDVAPRLYDFTGDGIQEVVVVESHKKFGARLAIFNIAGEGKLLAATPYIGTRFRWLAPIGIADFSGDGNIDIAYIDRPHLAKTLRVWTYRDGKLIETANTTGLSNHRIGDDFISGGVRTCNGTPEMITADAAWKRVIATRFENGKLTKTDLGPFKGKRSFKRALSC
jgi:hypothetical protein